MEKIKGKMGKTGNKWRKYGEKWGKQGKMEKIRGKMGKTGKPWRKSKGNMGRHLKKNCGNIWGILETYLDIFQPENHRVENVGFKLSKLNQIGSLVILSKMSMYEQTLQTMIWKVLRCYFVFDSFNFLACQNINGTFEELKMDVLSHFCLPSISVKFLRRLTSIIYGKHLQFMGQNVRVTRFLKVMFILSQP